MSYDQQFNQDAAAAVMESEKKKLSSKRISIIKKMEDVAEYQEPDGVG